MNIKRHNTNTQRKKHNAEENHKQMSNTGPTHSQRFLGDKGKKTMRNEYFVAVNQFMMPIVKIDKM